MTKIQVDIPDAWLDDLRRIFDKRVGSTEIPIANRHLVRWCVEQYRKGASLGSSENIPETHEAHEEIPVRTPSIPDTVSGAHRTHVEISRESPRETPKRIPPLEEVLDEIDRHAAANVETSV